MVRKRIKCAGLVQVCTLLGAAATEDLSVATKAALKAVEATVGALSKSFQVPLVETTLERWKSQESELATLIATCTKSHDEAISKLDIELGETLDNEHHKLEQKLWELTLSKLQDVVATVATGWMHISLPCALSLTGSQ